MSDLERLLVKSGVSPVDADWIGSVVADLPDIYAASRFVVANWNAATLNEISRDAVTAWWSNTAISSKFKRLLTATGL
ncbi:MAG TPA: hypothetical protein PKH77_17770 [Anaerolineae bacterium]|nr:hypothetical protein [Anaerolineae bacterium]